MSVRRAAASALLFALILCGAAPLAPASRATAQELDRSPKALAAAVAPMLRQRSDAFRRHDERAYLATVDPRDSAFVARQRASVRNARGVTFAAFRLEPMVDDVGDLSRASDRRRFGDATVVLQVRETYELAGGYDTGTPAMEDLFLTLTRDSRGAWRVAADDALDLVGLQSARHPWDFAPVSTRASAHFLAMFPPNQADEAKPVLDEAEAAFARVQPSWSPRWNTKVVIELPKDVASLGRRIQATFPLDDFVAFAVSGGDMDGLSFRFVGRRVMINPANFLRNAAATRRQILEHELVHVASREVAGPYLTAWLEEGVAQVIGDGESAVGLGPVRDAVRRGSFTGRLPEDYEFVVGGSQRIFRSYAESYLAAREVERIAGRAGLIRLYVAAGDDGRLGPGTTTYRLDLAVRRALGMSLADLQRRWAADVRANRLS